MAAAIKELKGLKEYFIRYRGNGSREDVNSFKTTYSFKMVRAKTLMVEDNTGAMEMFIYHNKKEDDGFGDWRIYDSKTGCMLWREAESAGRTKKEALSALQKRLDKISIAEIREKEDNFLQWTKDKEMKRVVYVGAEQ